MPNMRRSDREAPKVASRRGIGRVARPYLDRFWENVQKSNDGCWIWTASVSRAGYGDIWVGLRPGVRIIKVHRLSWEIHYGPIPDGLFVCHRCDNPRCVRPDHLFLGTHTDNMRDASAKGRLRSTHESAFRQCDWEFKQAWQTFHMTHARLRLVCSTCNLRRGRTP